MLKTDFEVSKQVQTHVGILTASAVIGRNVMVNHAIPFISRLSRLAASAIVRIKSLSLLASWAIRCCMRLYSY